MTEIRTFNTPQEAYIAKGMLENHGIPSEVQLNSLYSIYPVNSQGAATLYVRDEDASHAFELLNSHND